MIPVRENSEVVMVYPDGFTTGLLAGLFKNMDLSNQHWDFSLPVPGGFLEALME